MTNIKQTLIKIKDDIKPLLIEIFPNMVEEIQFAYEDNFQEWFGMLFKLNEWTVSPAMIDINNIEMSLSQTEQALQELNNYESLEDYGFISTVEMENSFHLIDGYHRVLLGRKKGIPKLRGCIWNKEPNNHANCSKIKKIIISNL